jgi:hypothetical protein
MLLGTRMAGGAVRYVRGVVIGGAREEQMPKERAPHVAEFTTPVSNLDTLSGTKKVPTMRSNQVSSDLDCNGRAVLYLTCFNAKLDRILATPRIFDNSSTINRSSACTSSTTTRIR